MSGKYKIGVLTGGGDVPGLNSCIRAFTYRAIDDGHEVVGIRRGWRGVASLNPDAPDSLREWLMPLGKQQVRTVDRHGGTFLHTSRTNPIRIRRKDLPGHLVPVYRPKVKVVGVGSSANPEHPQSPLLGELSGHVRCRVLAGMGPHVLDRFAATSRHAERFNA